MFSCSTCGDVVGAVAPVPVCGVVVAAPDGWVVVVVVVEVEPFEVVLLIVPVVLDEFAPAPTAPVVAVPVPPGVVVAVALAAGC